MLKDMHVKWFAVFLSHETLVQAHNFRFAKKNVQLTESAFLTSFEEHFRIALLLHQCWGKWSDCLKLEFAGEHAEKL